MPTTDTVSFTDTTKNQLLGTANLGASTANFLLSSSNITAGTESSDALVVDLNNDGKPDIVIENSGDVTCGSAGGSTPSLTILLGNGDGTFTAKQTLTGAQFCHNLATGDFNNDGNADIVLAGGGGLLLGHGDGTFTISPIADLGSGAPVVGDFNNDGNADIIGLNGVVLLGNGDGTFTSSTNTALAAATGVLSLATADLNGDGKLDIIALASNFSNGSSNSTILVLTNTGSGTFQQRVPPFALDPHFTTNGSSRNLAVGDFNGDGNLDVAISGLYSANVNPAAAFLVLQGDGTGFLNGTPIVSVSATEGYGSNWSSIIAADFNGDGRTDIATLVDESNIIVSLSNSDGTFTTAATLPSQYGDSPDVVTLLTGDFNGDGVPDLIAINSDSGDTNGGNPPVVASSIVALTQRTQTASATLTNVAITGTGNHTVQAAYSGDSTFGLASNTSNTMSLASVTIATTLSLTVNPSTSTFGQQIVLSATLAPYTSQGSITNGETVTFMNGSASIGTGTLSSGVATLNITSLAVGTDSLTAVYGGDVNFAPSTSPSAIYTVTAIAPVTPTILLTSSANPTLLQNSIIFTAALTSTQGTPSGSVTFFDGTTTLGTATLTTTGSATYSTSSLTVGAHTITGVYSGDSTFSKVTSAILTETIENFSLTTTGTSSTQSVSTSGGTATYSLSLSPSGGTTFPSTVSFAVSGLPTGATATFSPQTIPAGGGTTTVTLTVQVPAQSAELQRNLWPSHLLPTVVAGFLLMPLAWRRRRMLAQGTGLLLLFVLSAVATCITGCGNSNPATSTTTPKSYTLVVTATAGSLSSTTNLTLNVQ